MIIVQSEQMGLVITLRVKEVVVHNGAVAVATVEEVELHIAVVVLVQRMAIQRI